MTGPGAAPDERPDDRECDCCEINDYDGDPFSDSDTACANCGHSPEEHGS